MKISCTWLQAYFDEKLPAPEKLAEMLTFSFAEVESIEKKGDDFVLDVKVLPDRACYALSHRGVAYEVSAILNLPKKKVEYPQPKVGETEALLVRVEAPELCPRYIARRVEGLTQKKNSWVKEHLDALDQRSINPVVDGANIVMFDRGQPLHAFDADKVEGGIVVRMAQKGERITTLDNREVALDESVLIIADEKSPLAIAGIKGGTKAAVTDTTKNLILESASFNASYIRKTSDRLGIKTDASKRYENRFTPALADRGMNDFSAYLFEMDKTAVFGEVTDVYADVLKNISIPVTAEHISRKLGLKLSETDLLAILKRLGIESEKKGAQLTLTPPFFRADLTIPEDIAEEVGRIIGYDKIPTVLPPKEKTAEISKPFYDEWKIREILVQHGFSEVMTSSFSDKGELAIAKPLAEDKKYARANLRGNFEKALKMNGLNAPLFGATETRIFEIGRIFPKSGEATSLALGVTGSKKGGGGTLIKDTLAVLAEAGIEVVGSEKDGVWEGSFSTRSDLVEKWDITVLPPQAEKFTPISLYPFIVRDVALFVSSDIKQESVAKVIRDSAGDLVVRGPELFDEFSKDGRKSLAFRLVFQSSDRTLSDVEVNTVMARVYDALKTEGWEIR